ncbi:hypothetical protein NMK71_05005 [Weeksellaceae bacterium KMM 9713]|uniref:Uncharacterized protein n=1 Tax=Profundicola chukchiensis TaxID=2961959 RepID=A0A9X4RVH4_9FLAO|nr:hypothetical protein [Profundicola chukchiensis]MDG4945765.1 hypothetical protein [Profundicola chukchiensis]
MNFHDFLVWLVILIIILLQFYFFIKNFVSIYRHKQSLVQIEDVEIQFRNEQAREELDVGLSQEMPNPITESVYKYVPKLTGDGWDRLFDSPNASTLYQLTKISDSTYSFQVFNDLSPMVEEDIYISPFSTFYNACTNLKVTPGHQKSVQNIKNGLIVKKGNRYFVDKKAIINF